jgi:hypothetical protein
MPKKKAKAGKGVGTKQISIKELDLRNRDSRAAFERIQSEVKKKFKRVTDPIRDSQRLSKDDFAIRINARG